MIAQHRSMCPLCDELIHPGNELRVVSEYSNGRVTQSMVWAHVICPEATEQAADVAALQQPRCTRCGLNHAGEC
jgi:hypothetical protein